MPDCFLGSMPELVQMGICKRSDFMKELSTSSTLYHVVYYRWFFSKTKRKEKGTCVGFSVHSITRLKWEREFQSTMAFFFSLSVLPISIRPIFYRWYPQWWMLSVSLNRWSGSLVTFPFPFLNIFSSRRSREQFPLHQPQQFIDQTHTFLKKKKNTSDHYHQHLIL